MTDYSGWISVKDRLPQEEGEVLVALHGTVHLAWYFSATKQWQTPSGTVCGTDDVTHWMPLPKPPKERRLGNA